MPADPKDVATVADFLGRLLGGIVLEKRVSLGLADLPALGALGRIPPNEYKSIVKAVATQPGVAEFVNACAGARAGG